MTTERETLRIIGSWMEDGRTRLPDHVLDAVLDQLPSTPQRRPGWPARRITHMNALAKYAIAAAAVVVVAIVGLNLVGGPGVGGVGSPAKPVSDHTPTATPRPDSRRRPGAGQLRRPSLPAPDDGLTVTYTVPEGWFAFEGIGLVPAGEPGTGPPGGIAFQFIDVTTINGDPCRVVAEQQTTSASGRGWIDLVEALREQTAYEVSEPIDVTIGGHSGKRVDIVMPTEPFAGQDGRLLGATKRSSGCGTTAGGSTRKDRPTAGRRTSSTSTERVSLSSSRTSQERCLRIVPSWTRSSTRSSSIPDLTGAPGE